jgi:FkbM family methyltransferase
MASRGITVDAVMDIGSYHGQFGDMCKAVWPTTQVISIEANPEHKRINPTQITACLGQKDGEWVEFFTPAPNIPSTGASYLRELTPYYTQATSTPMQTQTLDSLWTQHQWRGTWHTSGLIKLDTQGSELMILAGAQRFLQTEKPRWILMEVSHQPYNQNAPTASEVVSSLLSWGYQWTDIWHQLRLNDAQLLQSDLLFERQPT